MNYKIVTTLGPGGWELYGKRFVDSFAKFWPANVELEIYTHHLDVLPQHPRATFVPLDNTDGFKKIVKLLGVEAKDGPSLNYAFKAVALSLAVTPSINWVGFLDADTETMRPVDAELLAKIFDESYDLTYLWRKSVRESEGSWFAINLQTRAGASLLADYCGLYETGEAFKLKKAHDNAVLDHISLIHRAHNLRVGNLSEGALGLDAFHQSPLGAYLIHYKGPDKTTIANPGLASPSRYEMLCSLAVHAYEQTGRAELVEVGTWNGSRAVQLAEALFAAGAPRVTYYGFDTFEEGNDRVHEGHSKPNATLDFVQQRLENYRMLCNRNGRIFDFMLMQGNTLVTLPASDEILKNVTFAYIDGGHSYETTLSDYNCLKHVPYVVFDDLILKDEPGAPTGPREVMAKHVNVKKQIWDSGNGYAGLTQTICFGIATAPEYAEYEIKQPLKVKPIDSVEKSEQFEHIVENTKAIKSWLQLYQAHGRTALLVSAGPTLPEYIEDIRKKQKAGAVIFAVKHALPVLKDAGITPNYTVLLDPRPVTGTSTHGVVRTKLFAKVVVGDKVLLATMTHPSVRELLEKQGANIIGWHAMTAALEKANLPETKIGMTVGGGTCAATRLPVLAYLMGFRRFDFYGYDFYYPTGTAQENIKQQLLTISVGKNQQQFLTTGELVAAIQDLDRWARWLIQNNLSIEFFGDGVGSIIWEQVSTEYKRPAEYIE